MDEFNAELARYQQAQAALGNSASEETAAQTVVNDLIDQVLLAQGAAQNGHGIDDAALQARIDALAAQAGSADALTAWQTAHGYTETGFRSALRRQMAAAWMRDQIAASIPATAEQVHVKQILLYNEKDAQSALEQLKNGSNFDSLAVAYDPTDPTHGELGWFPRGYLFEPTLEAAAFALQPGQYSNILQIQAEYYILMVVERDPNRTLSPDALLTLQERAVQDWLTQRRNTSTILFAP